MEDDLNWNIKTKAEERAEYEQELLDEPDSDDEDITMADANSIHSASGTSSAASAGAAAALDSSSAAASVSRGREVDESLRFLQQAFGKGNKSVSSAQQQPTQVQQQSSSSSSSSTSQPTKPKKTVRISEPDFQEKKSNHVNVENGGESQDEDDDDDASDEEDEDEIGDNRAADEAFQAELEKSMAGGSNAGEEDLLSKIFKQGAANWQNNPNRPRPTTEGGDGAEAEAESTEEGRSSISEEQLDYQIYSDQFLEECNTRDASQRLKWQQTMVSGLASLRLAAQQYLSLYTSSHLFQKDSISFRVCCPDFHHENCEQSPASSISASSAAAVATKRSSTAATASSSAAHSSTVPHLHGCSSFGDNVDDEWLFIWLLLTLSSHYSDLSICARDSDGEVLAIELAEVLPESLSSPSKALNRIWIRRGLVHFIPSPSNPQQLALIPLKPSLEQSLQILKQQLVPTAADGAVQKVLLKKLQPFIDASMKQESSKFFLAAPALSTNHFAKVFVPWTVASLLAKYPQLLSEFINQLCYRDPIDMKRANKMKRILGGTEKKKSSTMCNEDSMTDSAPNSSSSSSLVPFVFLRVRFTHCLYAQLFHQRFGAPRVFASHIASSLSSHEDSDETRTSSKTHGPLVQRAIDLGVKITAGAEMWYHNQRDDIERRKQKKKVLLAHKMSASSNAPSLNKSEKESEDVVRLAHQAQTAVLQSNKDVETLLSASPSLLSEWQIFSQHLTLRQADSLFSASTFFRSAVLSFLYAHAHPHECTEQEAEDAYVLDGAESACFDVESENNEAVLAQIRSLKQSSESLSSASFYRAGNNVVLPSPVRLISLTDHLCDTSLSSNSSATSTDVASSPACFTTSFHALSADDNDAWLHMSEQDLDKILLSHMSSASSTTQQSNKEVDGEDILRSMKKFVNQMSDIEGVEPEKIAAENKKLQEANATAATKPTSAEKSSKSVGQQIQIDTDEIVKLMNQARSNPASISAGLSIEQIAAEALRQSQLLASRVASSTIASSTSTKRASHPTLSKEQKFSHSKSDPNEILPDKENTRPPKNNRYAAAFGNERPVEIQDLPLATAAPPASAISSHDAVKRKPAEERDEPNKRQQVSSSATAAGDNNPDREPSLKDYMAAMDDDLKAQGLSSSMVPSATDELPVVGSEIDGSDSMDVAVLSNLLESHAAEMEAAAINAGGQLHAGPVGSLFASMGLQLSTNNLSGNSSSKKK